MDPQTVSLIQARSGVVLTHEVGGSATHYRRKARRRRLVPVLPGAWVADTQPVTAQVQVEAMRAVGDDESIVLGLGALWLYGVAPEPDSLKLGVRHSPKRAPIQALEVVRVTDRVLIGARCVQGIRVPRFEVAVVQAARDLDASEVLTLLEAALRSRRTTVGRLQAATGKGFAGSAAVRCGLKEVRGGSLEREVRLLQTALAVRGVTGLVTEKRFVNADGAACYADLYDELGQSVIEVDGYASHSERQRFQADRRRDRWMNHEHGVHTMRVDAQEIRTDLDRLADELAECLLARRPQGTPSA